MALSIVIAGGGCRAFWCLGAYDALADVIGEPLEFAGVSAGAAMATMVAAGRAAETFVHFREAVSRNGRNFHPKRWLSRKTAFPHEAMYRDTLEFTLADGGYERLMAGPSVRILQASVQPGEAMVPTVLRAMQAYSKRKAEGRLHAPDGAPRGMSWRVAVAQEAATPAQLIDEVITSSATWPVTNLPRHGGRTWVDGGLVDNVPVRALSARARSGAVLVFLTRPYDTKLLSSDQGRLYLAPSEPVPVKKWDYTRADLLLATFDRGRRDGQAARDRVKSLLAGT